MTVTLPFWAYILLLAFAATGAGVVGRDIAEMFINWRYRP